MHATRSLRAQPAALRQSTDPIYPLRRHAPPPPCSDAEPPNSDHRSRTWNQGPVRQVQPRSVRRLRPQPTEGSRVKVDPYDPSYVWARFEGEWLECPIAEGREYLVGRTPQEIRILCRELVTRRTLARGKRDDNALLLGEFHREIQKERADSPLRREYARAGEQVRPPRPGSDASYRAPRRFRGESRARHFFSTNRTRRSQIHLRVRSVFRERNSRSATKTWTAPHERSARQGPHLIAEDRAPRRSRQRWLGICKLSPPGCWSTSITETRRQRCVKS